MNISLISDLSVKRTYTADHLTIPFEIVHWGKERGKHEPLNNGRGCWNYYIYLLESRLTNFQNFWLEPEVKEFSPGGTKYLYYDYFSSPLSAVDWHGGITFWEGDNILLPGHRSIKVGCDYSHYFDEQRGFDYTLEDVFADCLHTIEQIHPLLSFK